MSAMVNAIIDPYSPSFSILKPPTANPTCEPIIKSLVNHAIKPGSIAMPTGILRASLIGAAQRLVLCSAHQWQASCPVGQVTMITTEICIPRVI